MTEKAKIGGDDADKQRALGRAGGKARARKLDRKKRAQIARAAALTRWRKRGV